MQALEKDMELHTLRAVNKERQRWEDREERLLRYIQTAEQDADKRDRREEGGGALDTESPLEEPPSQETAEEIVSVHEQIRDNSGPGSSVGVGTKPHPSFGDHTSTACYGPLNQLPPLTSYKGEVGPDNETIDEWMEHFSMLAEECKWTQRAKLLHLTSRLEKQAYAFYRSCPPTIKIHTRA